MRALKELYKAGIKIGSALDACFGRTFVPDPIVADFYLSLGEYCTPALRLRELGLRLCSCPLDWILTTPESYPLVPELYATGFEHYFTDITEESECHGKFRRVWDNRYHLLSIHHFRGGISLEEGRDEMRRTAKARLAFVEECLRMAEHTVFVSGRSEEPETLASLMPVMQKMYGGKITHINVRNGETPSKRVFPIGDGLLLYDYTCPVEEVPDVNQWKKQYRVNHQWKRILARCRLTGSLAPKNAEDAKEAYEA